MPAPRQVQRTVLLAVLSIALGLGTVFLIAAWPGLPQFYAAPIVMMLISALYFLASRAHTSLRRRLLTSAHGLVAAILTLVAMALYASSNSRPIYGLPFLFLYLIPLGLVGASLLSYPGPKRMHVLQGPNLGAMLWGAFTGGMAVTGDWL
jgi:hypothetical protein